MGIAMKKTQSVRSGVLRTILGIALALLLIVPMVTEDVFASSSALQYGMTPIYGRDIEDGTWPIEVRSNSKYYKIASCQLTVKGDKMTAVITMNSTSYSYAYPGTKLEAKKDDAGSFLIIRNDPDQLRLGSGRSAGHTTTHRNLLILHPLSPH